MILTLNRQPSWQNTTLGQLWRDEAFECWTLEDQVRHAAKVPGATAIPAGRYLVLLTFSPRFDRVMPLIDGVPGFSGIRIHPGNSAENTEGCLLVGDTVVNARRIADSRAAFERLFAALERATGDIWIDIVDGDAHAA